MYVPLEHTMRITASGSPRADVSATLMREDADAGRDSLPGDSIPLRSIPAPPIVSCVPSGLVSNGPLPLPLSGGGQAPEGEHPNRYALVFGNEVAGVQQEVVDACDFALEIPQQGTKHSLNVSVSIGVVLWGIMAH